MTPPTLNSRTNIDRRIAMKQSSLPSMVLLVILILSSIALAGVPGLINYQGRLSDAAGDPVADDSYEIQFVIYDSESGSTELWNSGFQSVSTVEGLFAVQLGAVPQPALPDDVFADSVRYLGITVDPDPELTPRIRLITVPYAYHSLRADTTDWTGLTNVPTGFADGVDDVGVGSRWISTDSVLYTDNYLGIARGGAGNSVHGDNAHTMVNLGVGSTTGASGQHYMYATVAGGTGNGATHEYTTVGGGRNNTAGAYYAIVGGGYDNVAGGNWATVGGGFRNAASGICASTGGGDNNIAGGNGATVGGGYRNSSSGGGATVGGGYDNTAGNVYATIGGGNQNTASGNTSLVGGGELNTASGYYATVGGGQSNSSAGNWSTIPGGFSNTIDVSAHFSYLFGIGSALTADSTFMVDLPHIRFGDEVSGYEFPTTDGTADQVMATDGSGQLSWTDMSVTTTNWTVIDSVLHTTNYLGIARGGVGNALLGDSAHSMVNLGIACTTGFSDFMMGEWDVVCATVSGGHENVAAMDYSTTSGGYDNAAYGYASTISGGLDNTTWTDGCAIGGGARNSAGGDMAWGANVGGGTDNTATGRDATVGGGSNNTAGDVDMEQGDYATVSGGRNNTADGLYCTIGGGQDNFAGTWVGSHSTVCGGAYDTASGFAATVCGGAFNKASGDFSFAAGQLAHATHDGSFVWSDGSAGAPFISTAEDRFHVLASGGVYLYTSSDLTAGMYLSAGGSSWNAVSDSTLKRNIREVDCRDIMERVSSLPVSRWSYKSQDESVEHVGPMAQDFHRLFGLGEDEEHINTLDLDGISLAAIKGLNQKLKAENEALNARLDDQQAQIDQLTALVQTMLARQNKDNQELTMNLKE
jgi:hypothetical protein